MLMWGQPPSAVRRARPDRVPFLGVTCGWNLFGGAIGGRLSVDLFGGCLFGGCLFGGCLEPGLWVAQRF